MNTPIPDIGIVIIGRNEGERLIRCLQSIQEQVCYIVYVDSGSSDGSVVYARSIGVDVVELDMRIPFSAGRARNEGFAAVIETRPHLAYVQFIDGDCELSDCWLQVALEYLTTNKCTAIVAGRRKEKYPDRSVYNLLCDVEWNSLVGEAKACGGDFMIRKDAFQQANGFNPSVIAGEEPELCYRLAGMGWKIYRLDHPMTLHDAAITRFSQWWKRAVRSGHAYAQGYALHGMEGHGYCRDESMKIWFWAFFFPLIIVLLSVWVGPGCFLLLSAYFLQFGRIAVRVNKRLRNPCHSVKYAFFTVLSKWPQLIGQITFIKRKILKKEFVVIEYQ